MVGFRMSDVCACLCTLSLEDVSSQALFNHVVWIPSGQAGESTTDRHPASGAQASVSRQACEKAEIPLEHPKVASRENMALTIELQDDSLLDYGWKTRPNDG